MKATRNTYTIVAAQSTGASYTGPTKDPNGLTIPGYDVLDIDVQCLQVNYTGTAVGTFSVQGSVDGVNYATLPFNINGTTVTSVAVPANPSPIIFDMYGSGVHYIQLVYTYTSGSAGTFTALITGKRLGD